MLAIRRLRNDGAAQAEGLDLVAEAKPRDPLFALPVVIPNPLYFGGVRNLLFASGAAPRSTRPSKGSDIEPTSISGTAVWSVREDGKMLQNRSSTQRASYSLSNSISD